MRTPEVTRSDPAAGARRVDVLDPGDEAWFRFVAGHRSSTIYHLPEWHRIFAGAFGYRGWLLAARDQVHGRIEGVLPLYLVRSPLGSRLVSVPFRDRGGILCTDPRAFDALMDACKQIGRECGTSLIEIKCPQAYDPEDARRNGLVEYHYWVNSRVDLAGLDADTLIQRIGAKNRNMLRQAERAGLDLEVRTDPAAVTAWYALHLVTQKRLGLPPFPLRFFAALQAALGPQSRSRIFFACLAGRPLAAFWLLFHGDAAIYAYSASAEEGQRLRANDFLMASALRWLVDKDVKIFDMGSDAPSQSQLLFFKRKWLAVQTPLPTYTVGSFPHHLADSSHDAYRLARWVARRLPVPALRVLGGLTTRFFG